MKKSLVALAALAVVGAASAQSSVTLYGSIDVNVTKSPGKKVQLGSNGESNGRFGFRGTEDLGGGLKAGFVLETGFTGDTGGFSSNSGLATIFNRAAFISLASDAAGTLSLGRTYNGAFFTILGGDPTGNAYGVGGAGASFLYSNAINTRHDNVVRYQTPKLGGFTADLATSFKGDFGTTRADATATRNLSSATEMGYNLAFAYSAGPLAAGLGLTKAPGLPGAGANDNNATIVTLSGSYDFGMAKVLAAFEKDGRYDNNENAWNVGASMPLGSGKLMAIYGENENGNAGTDKHKLAQIAYSYALSKRTSVYGAIESNKYDGLANAADGSTAQLGFNHKF